jgi:hypothetical protein
MILGFAEGFPTMLKGEIAMVFLLNGLNELMSTIILI